MSLTPYKVILSTQILEKQTCFYFCCHQNFLTTVAVLLEAGSYVNAQTQLGETALMKVTISCNKPKLSPVAGVDAQSTW